MEKQNNKLEYGSNMGMRSDSYFPITLNEKGEEVIGVGVGFQRIRRITGYLVGTIDRFNNAKKAEVRDRVKHMGATQGSTGTGRALSSRIHGRIKNKI